MADHLVVRSYARVFRVDRRIYRVDRWPIPVPGGVPLRGVVYFVVALLAVLVSGRIPGLGELVGELNPPLRYVVLPLAVAVLGTQVAPDGRTAHRFGWDWLRFQVRAKRRCAGRPVPLEREPVAWHGDLPTAWDEHAPELHGGRVSGPARVDFRVPVQVSRRRRRRIARLNQGGRDGTIVVLEAGETLEVRR